MNTPTTTAPEPEMRGMVNAMLSIYFHCERARSGAAATHLRAKSGDPVRLDAPPPQYKILSLDDAIKALRDGNPPADLVAFTIMVLSRSVREMGGKQQELLALMEKWFVQVTAMGEDTGHKDKTPAEAAQAIYKAIFPEGGERVQGETFERAYEVLTRRSLGDYKIFDHYVKIGRHG